MYREDTDDKSKSQKGGKKSGAKQTSRGKGKPELEEKKDAKEDEEAGKMKDNNLISELPWLDDYDGGGDGGGDDDDSGKSRDQWAAAIGWLWKW